MYSKIRGSSGYDTAVKGKVLKVTRKLITTQTAKALGVVDAMVSRDFYIYVTPESSTSMFRVDVRWFGEFSVNSWDVCFNIYRDGSRINETFGNDANGTGIAVPVSTYHTDYASTPELLTLSTLDKTPGTAGVPIMFSLAAIAYSTRTIYTNRTVSLGGWGYELGSSEITVTEIEV